MKHYLGAEEGEGGLRWGNYELLEVVGRGGMATVVRARRVPSATGPEVALKFLHRELTQDPDSLEAFRLEGQFGVRLHHENLGLTFGLESADGRSALVLEFIRGPSVDRLQELLLGAPFAGGDATAVASVVASIARGLHALHGMAGQDGAPLNAVHRDVTPKNIIVTLEGVPKLVDFGIAFSNERTFRTATGVIKGKIAYMAPEYLRGLDWDHRVDVWSMGVVLWELLTGRRLFRSESPTRAIQAILSAPIPSPSQLRPEVPPRLSRIALRALEREPARRFPSAAHLASELADFSGRDNAESRSAIAAWLVRLSATKRPGGKRPAHSASGPGEPSDTQPTGTAVQGRRLSG